MAKLVDQLRQLRTDVAQLIERDPEQEVTGQALPLIDAIISEARAALPSDSTLAAQIVEVISAEMIEAGEPLRAADALLIVGQLLAVLDDHDDPRLIEPDRLLLARLLDLLPSTTGVVPFLRDHDLGAAFRWEWVAPLDEFVQRWDNAEHVFHDPDVELERQHLLARAQEFVHRLAVESGPEEGGWNAVVPVRHRDIFRLGDFGEDVRRVDGLNELATGVYEQHQRLVSTARRRLGS